MAIEPLDVHRRHAVLAAAALACTPSSRAAEPKAKLSLTTGALPPLGAAPGHPGFVAELARAAFGRIGVEVEVTSVPPERALINANSGIDDGDLLRIAGVEQEYRNLMRVPEKSLDFEFIAYTQRGDIQIRNWVDLQPLSVAFAQGWKIFELHTRQAREVTRAASIHDLFPLLDKGRADVILMDRWQGQWIVRQQGWKVRLQEPPLARVEMFMYLNRKHATLVPKVAQALAEMKADGSWQRLYDLHLKPLDTR